jgi:hypothetical protein
MTTSTRPAAILCAIAAIGCGASMGPTDAQGQAGMGGSLFDAGDSSGEGGSSTGGSIGEIDGSAGSSAGDSGGTIGAGTAGAAGTSVGDDGGGAGAGGGGTSGASGRGGGGGSTAGTGGSAVVYEAAINGTLTDFLLVVAQVTQDGQTIRFWLNGVHISFRLTIDFVVPMGTTQGDYSCGSSGTNSLSILYMSPNGPEYATPPIITMGSCSVHFTSIPANGTGRLAGTFSATLAFYRPPFDAPGPWDVTPVSITDGVIDLPVPGEFRR